MQSHCFHLSSGLIDMIGSNADAQRLNDELARLRAENERLTGALQEIANTPTSPDNHDLVAVIMLAQYTIRDGRNGPR